MANEVFGWISILLSVAMGLWMGIRFQSNDWLGGYDSLPRRMVRLAHVALAALGVINLESARTLGELVLPPGLIRAVSFGFITAGITMPACCLFIASGRRRFEMFLLPVGCLIAALLLTMRGLIR